MEILTLNYNIWREIYWMDLRTDLRFQKEGSVSFDRFIFMTQIVESAWCGRPGFSPWVGKILWRRDWLPTPVFLPGEFHRQRSLAGYSTQGHKVSDKTERLTHCTSKLKTTEKKTLQKIIRNPYCAKQSQVS